MATVSARSAARRLRLGRRVGDHRRRPHDRPVVELALVGARRAERQDAEAGAEPVVAQHRVARRGSRSRSRSRRGSSRLGVGEVAAARSPRPRASRAGTARRRRRAARCRRCRPAAGRGGARWPAAIAAAAAAASRVSQSASITATAVPVAPNTVSTRSVGAAGRAVGQHRGERRRRAPPGRARARPRRARSTAGRRPAARSASRTRSTAAPGATADRTSLSVAWSTGTLYQPRRRVSSDCAGQPRGPLRCGERVA